MSFYKKVFGLVFIHILLMIMYGMAYADPDIKAEIDREVYDLGDTITLRVKVFNNPGLHSLFFDLSYDDSVLLFEGIEEGLFVRRIIEEGELLYAHSDSQTSSVVGSHVIVSYALKGSNRETQETGTVVEMRFRVIDPGLPSTSYGFSFNDTGVHNGQGGEIADAEWKDSDIFTIGSASPDAFIVISSPYENQVFYTDVVEVDATSTADPNYTIVLSNLDTGYESDPLSAEAGSVIGRIVPVSYGFNRIDASLFDNLNNSIASDRVVVYRSEDDKFIKIIRPRDHSLLNTDMTQVLVASSFGNVRVNGINTELLGEKYGDKDIYRANVWLRRGFNRITATAESLEGAVYTDEIIVFYQKDDSVFRFITPLSGEVFKSSPDSRLFIKGEISSLYKSGGMGESSEGAEPNTVTLKVIYYPKNPLLRTRVLIDDLLAKIGETDIVSGGSQAPYMFYNDSPINLDGLDSGEIEIIAYKNRKRESWENEIHRFVYIDNSRLWIDLVQPNIFGSDVLDTPYKLKSFNNPEQPTDPVYNNIGLTDDGSFKLIPTENIVEEELEFGASTKKITDLIELRNGDLYALINEKNALKIYKREFGAAGWDLAVSREDMYGYDICDTDIGVLVGVSNLFSSDNSGLYLLQEKTLINITIDKPIPHVQFIESKGGEIYLYGNDYSHLYSFNIFSMIDENGRLKATVVDSIPFDNNLFLEQFELSDDCKTAVLRTSGGNVSFYQNRTGESYRLIDFDDEIFNPNQEFKRVVRGEYEDGAYNTYLLVKEESSSALVVMENKNTHRLIVTGVDLDFEPEETLLGVSFKNDNFLFLHHIDTTNNYRVRRGQILFDTLYPDDKVLEYTAQTGVNPQAGNLKLLMTKYETLYLGFGNDLGEERLYQFSSTYPPVGSVSFNYINRDIDGIAGFSFELDPIWGDSEYIQFGFAVKEGSGAGEKTIFGKEQVPVSEFLNAESEQFRVSSSYDAALGREIVVVEFTNLQKERFLFFEIEIKSAGNISPSLSNLTIQKKVPVKLPKSSEEIIYLPINGYIYDPTVKEVNIQEIKLQLKRDGSFSYNYPIYSSEKEVPIEIYCFNSAGERASVSFSVEIFESINDLSSLVFKDEDDYALIFENGNELHTEKEIVKVSGNYYGLIGAICGYELYGYSYEGGQETLILLRRGVFETHVDKTIDPGLEYLGSGYESGEFTDQKIRLSPGKQRLIIYVENPGGFRREYRIGEKYPDVLYNLPESEQEIVITNLDIQEINPPYFVETIPIDKCIELDTYETDTEPYLFTRNYIIRGEIKSLYKFSDLKIKSFSSDVTFEDNGTEIIAPVDRSNRFQIGISIKMPENTASEDYNIAFIPRAPFLKWMRTGLCIKAKKSFANTYIVSDFSEMSADKWTLEEKKALEKPLRVKIELNRYVPPGTHLHLLVNYETTITGELSEINPGGGVYKVVKNLEEINLAGVKFGRNRVQWELTYGPDKISSSTSGRPGMSDFIFDLEKVAPYAPTAIDFPIRLQTYYNDTDTPLPNITITKDLNTEVEIRLNDEVFWKDSGKDTVYNGNLYTGTLVEGRNYLSVYYSEKSAQSETVQYSFLYDTKAPEVSISSYDYIENYTKLDRITAVIHEANLNKVALLYVFDPVQGDTEINSEPEIIYLENDIYKAQWKNLGVYTPSLKPSATNILRVKVRDHSEKETLSAPFEGLEGIDRPEPESAVAIPLPIRNFNQSTSTPFFRNEIDYENRPFPNHAKFYNSSVRLEDIIVSSNELFLVERHDTIDLGNSNPNDGYDIVVKNGGKLIARAGNSVRFMPGFRVEKGGELRVEVGIGDIGEEPDAVFSHNKAAEAMSFFFWFRYEHEDYYVSDIDIDRRILTLYEDGQNSVYLAYRDNSETVGDEYLSMIHEDSGALNTIMGGDGVAISRELRPNDWNLVILGVDGISDTLYLSVNDKIALSANYAATDLEIVMNKLLDGAQQYYFGSRRADAGESGHFSIAQAFYVNQLVDVDTLQEIPLPPEEEFQQYAGENHRYYAFNTMNDDVGADYYLLRPTGKDYFTNLENVDYTQSQEKGSLKASNLHQNLLKVSNDVVIFKDSTNPITFNLTVIPGLDGKSIKLEPKDPLYSGRYFFGNTLSNHGLRNDKWYTVSGEVLPVKEGGQPVDARLVVRIDGEEQSMRLKEGEFHFVYNNTTNQTPDTVIMYIETKNALKISKDIIFTEGNYLLPVSPLDGMNEYDRSNASTTYIFHSQGTIHFWYKPFNVNESGFVNYGTVLFDSEYFRIGTQIPDGKDYACYYAAIKDPAMGMTQPACFMETDIPVEPGWQHIQLSYNISGDGNNDIVYLYIDGIMAARSERNSLPVFGTMAGESPNGDNVSIGSDSDGAVYAEGYIDELTLSHLYRGSVFECKDPLEFMYSDSPSPALTIQTVGVSDAAIDSSLFVLKSRDGSPRLRSSPVSFMSGDKGHGLDIIGLESDSYMLITRMTINGHRYDNIFNFTKNDRPRFVMKDVTPLIISGVESDIDFSLGYDDSYLLNTKEAKYAGAAVQIRGTLSGEPFEKTVYILQDYYYEQDRTKWLITDGNDILPEKLAVSGDSINFRFPDTKSATSIDWELRSFYFEGVFDPLQHNFDQQPEEKIGTIPTACMTVKIVALENIEYKLNVKIGSEMSSGNGKEILSQLSIGYFITALDESGYQKSDVIELNERREIDIYYDDILSHFGKYNCILSIRYQGASYGPQNLTLNWEKIESSVNIGDEKRLVINDFSLLYLDKENDKARLYLEYEQNGLTNKIEYNLTIISDQAKSMVVDQSGLLPPFDNFKILDVNGIPKGVSHARITLSSTEEGLLQKSDLTIINSATAPEIILTSTVPSLIAYNNVMFSWRGFHEGVFKPEIEYSYNFDNQGWSAPNPQWRKLELYNLEEGYHKFRVKAIYNGEESPEGSVTFFVDVNRPSFDPSKIEVQEIFDEDGVLYAVNIIGAEGAVQDASLTALSLNGQNIKIGTDGSFVSYSVPLIYDGTNELVLTAYDKVGNFTDYTLIVENRITEILFPDTTRHVRFAPMTIVGRINPEIDAGLEIYVFDPMSTDNGADNFRGWKKAKMNEDRAFFVEDIFVNPGTSYREADTPLIMACVFESGKIFKRVIEVRAKEILMPIDIELSTHAAEGETAETVVQIGCKANVDNISSWSIDFDGDGIYDDVRMVDNPAYGKECNWEHTYSSIGLVKPRVRIITLDGNYFSVAEEIIIHEKIKEASNIIVNSPISMSVLHMPDASQRIFVLAGENDAYRIEVYEIGRNDHYISNRLFTVSLEGFGIENPVKIEALDIDHIYIVSNRNGRGNIYVLRRNNIGNYLPVPEAEFQLLDTIRDIDTDEKTLYIGLENQGSLITVPLADSLPVHKDLAIAEPEIPNSRPLSGNLGIARDDTGLLVADFYNQRIVRFSESLKVLEFYGAFGDGEGEFLKPAIIRSFQNRIFIYDESRYDIQVFGPFFNPVTTLRYNTNPEYDNYLPPDFLIDLADMGIITRDEGGMLYYYALLLSRSSGKMAMLRLPQWEELRAHIRNNKIVFLQDGEVYTAKPSGSDLAKIITSDSFPRIEGTLDYPALSPDGRQLVFTSRTELYDGNPTSGGGESDYYAYDNLYVIDVNGENLMRIPLGEINNYEIERPVFNSNGDKLVFSAKQAHGKWQVYVYNFATGGIARLFTSTENARFPYYSPDDRFVVFTTDYDGDEEIEIFDTENPTVRVAVTNNHSRDSFPVWNSVYPFEISNPDLEIESKIAFVSERDYHKGIYYVYMARRSESDIRVVTKNGQETGDDPDSAAIEITTAAEEGDYPCFTGDGKSVIFEYFDGERPNLKRYSFETAELSKLLLPSGARKPAGMKNTIAHFAATAVNGDEVALSWTRYTDCDIFYTVRFRINKEGEPFVQKKVFTQDSTRLLGLDMGVEYLFRVSIVENGIEAAATQWKKVLMPEVAARPSYKIDESNPYLVHLHAWKPKPETEWNFSWIIDNREFSVSSSQDYVYEFGTSGKKTVVLKASNRANTYTSISDPMQLDIISDIHPVIEYELVNDSSAIDLDASNTEGNKIDWAATSWIISGPGHPPLPPVNGSKVIIPLDAFQHKINVNLTMRRIPVADQTTTDIIEKNLVIDLDFKDVKPVITYEIDPKNKRLFRFSGNASLGNIDWTRARWSIYADGAEIHREDFVSSFAFLFPESGSEVSYSVALTVPRINDGKTETAAIIVDVEPAPIEPVIDYEILSLKEGNNVVGAKILFSCSGSKGSSIDFSQAKWSVPIAGAYGEQPSQTGPTAIYNLFDIDEDTHVEVSLTLMRRGGADATTVTKMINISSGDMAKTELIVDTTVEDTEKGKVLILDALSSKGPNIDWERTEWLIDGQYTRKGPVTRIDISQSGEERVVRYVCTLYRYGDEPLIKIGEIVIGGKEIRPLISYRKLKGGDGYVFELSVLDTPGINIDWERTMWYIFDGNENVVQKQGAQVSHAFAPREEAHGYPVMATMYYKGDSMPFVGYTSIDVEGDELIPVIRWDSSHERTDENVVHFSAESSSGANIEWSRTKWSFGDSSEAQYGPAVVHKYPVDSANKEYKVSLTITRRLANGIEETKTAYKTIRIGADKVKPVIKAKLYTNGYLLLSAEESEGRGLMLDRCLWQFEGEGDTEAYTENQQFGTVERTSTTNDNSVHWSFTAGFQNLVAIATQTTEGTIGEVTTTDTTSYEDYINRNRSFSTSNTHTGAVCRRYVGTYDIRTAQRDMRRAIRVTLFVYRQSADGGMKGESITVNIDLEQASQSGGVRYE